MYAHIRQVFPKPACRWKSLYYLSKREVTHGSITSLRIRDASWLTQNLNNFDYFSHFLTDIRNKLIGLTNFYYLTYNGCKYVATAFVKIILKRVSVTLRVMPQENHMGPLLKLISHPKAPEKIPATKSPGSPLKCPIVSITKRGNSWSPAVITSLLKKINQQNSQRDLPFILIC